MTNNQQKFLKWLKYYDNIAETGNLESELGWRATKIAAVGRSLKKKGIITIGGGGDSFAGEHKGSIYELVGRKK